ncbi:MAG: hypothetical protein DI616_12915 [Paracoccus denitrificans]|uniref:PEP-utilising enzyme mobile domain-containing protein n=1 Tax=Paracoccus denitrificans TaxID=266 RepID=A0A533I5F9_PARDE|nr:MAG: hypothetical protein DI616_12915 [Paracoccus denitrificans]
MDRIFHVSRFDLPEGEGAIQRVEEPLFKARPFSLRKGHSVLSGGGSMVYDQKTDDIILTIGDFSLNGVSNDFPGDIPLKLESIPLSQDPAPLLAAIAASAAYPSRPAQTAPDPDWRALFPRKPMRRWIARSLTNWAKARVRDRENLRFERTRIFGYARRVFLALGREFHARGLLDDPRDIFLLTTHEVLGAVEGFGLSPDLKAIASLRKAEDAAAARRSDPPERIEIRGPAIAPVWHGAKAVTSDARIQTGTGCSAGRITARARIIRDPRRESLQPGDILVARHTDPGWIAVFSNASAIVVERGSLLSHSAIVARELGIPCVVGLKGATDWITDGQRITVDGATGMVERLE